MNRIYRIESGSPELVGDVGYQANWKDNNPPDPTGLPNSAHILNKPDNIKIEVINITNINDALTSIDKEAFYYGVGL